MKIEKITTVEQECCFSGLTLLSKEEYVKRKNSIKPIESWWWLSSPGYGSHRASSVVDDGSLDYFNRVDMGHGYVRPALVILNPKSQNLKIGDKFKFYEHNWTIISAKYALCDEPFCYMAFRKNWKAENANIYDASDIKIYLDNEWRRMKNGEQDDEG